MIGVRKGDFLEALDAPDALVVAPTNGVVARRGLVMGAGAARALAERVGDAARVLGQAVREEGEYIPERRAFLYGFVARRVGGRWIGAFQTKLHFSEAAEYGLVSLAARKLYRFMADHPALEVHMAYPGIGLGGLRPSLVLQAMEGALEEFCEGSRESLTDRLFLYRLGGRDEQDLGARQ